MPDVEQRLLQRVFRIRHLMLGGMGLYKIFATGQKRGREEYRSVGRFASIKMHERKKRLNGIRVYRTISNYVNKRGSLFIENYPFIE